MDIELEKKISTRLFVGCLITSEVKMHLNQSQSWKNAKVFPQEDVESLTEVRFKEKEYLGCYLKEDQASVEKLKMMEERLKAAIKLHCPQLNASLPFCVLSQVFIN